MVKAPNRDGSVSKVAPTASTSQLDAFVSAEDAERRRAQLEAMNPGRRCLVVTLWRPTTEGPPLTASAVALLAEVGLVFDARGAYLFFRRIDTA